MSFRLASNNDITATVTVQLACLFVGSVVDILIDLTIVCEADVTQLLRVEAAALQINTIYIYNQTHDHYITTNKLQC